MRSNISSICSMEKEHKKETDRCPGGNTAGVPRLGVCGGSPGCRIPPTVNCLASSMDLDAVQVLPYNIESASLFAASCTLSIKLNATDVVFGVRLSQILCTVTSDSIRV